MAQNTIQTNIHNHQYDELENYALFLSGLNVTHEDWLGQNLYGSCTNYG